MSEKLDQIMKELPEHLKRQVELYAESLLRNNGAKQKKLRLSWAGALKEYKDKYTSLELQQKALEWWGD